MTVTIFHTVLLILTLHFSLSPLLYFQLNALNHRTTNVGLDCVDYKSSLDALGYRQMDLMSVIIKDWHTILICG